jgi:ABC-2 type transport system permease protein
MSTSTSKQVPTWRIIAEREVSVRIRDKVFVGSTLFLLVGVLAAVILSSWLGGRPQTYDLAVVDTSASDVAGVAQEQLRAQNDSEDEIATTSYADVAAAEQAVTDEEVDAALLPTDAGFEVVGGSDVDGELQAALSAAVSQVVTQANAEQQDVDLEALARGATLEERLLDADADDAGAQSAVAVGFAIIFLFTAMSFGMAIAQSVVQEKESRVVEILAAAVPVRQMLWGKIVGNTLLAVGQIVILVAVGAAALAVVGETDLLSGVGPAAVWYVVLFLLGFLALASLWTVAGSLASSQEDLQSTTLPGQLLLFVPYFVAVTASDAVQEVFSMLPIVSTMILPGRIAQGEAPMWQIAVAVVATIVAAVLLVRLGARLYERTLLQTSRKLSYREAFKLPAS